METLDYEYLAGLVKKSQMGDSNAFAELYTATYQKIYSYSYRYLNDENLAQDALQETFVQALKNIGNLQNPQLFVAWLNRINFMVCYDMKHDIKEDVLNEDAMGIFDTLEDDSHFEDDVISIDSRQYIIKQIMSLPLTESQVIMMYYYQQLKIDDIADSLDLSRSTVKRYLKSGKEHLNKLLSNLQN